MRKVMIYKWTSKNPNSSVHCHVFKRYLRSPDLEICLYYETSENKKLGIICIFRKVATATTADQCVCSAFG